MQPTALTLTRIIKAPREKVFAAWTDPKLLVKWWGPVSVTCSHAEVDLRVGGAYRLANLHEDGSTTWISGHFVRISVPDELVYTWSIGEPEGLPTLVMVTFLPHPQGTELSLTHERFTDPSLRDMHLQGWGGCIDGLEALIG